MSPRVSLLILFIVIPVYARRGGGRGHGGHGGHTYPSSHGLSGTGTGNGHYSGGGTYPQSTGLSGNNRATHGTTYHHTEVHHHHYSPPQQINYGSGYHPVYHERPPVYVYEYRNSGSRFDTLLTGLALYNLGRMSAHHSHYDSHREYTGTPGEVCKMVISKTNGEYEETRIDCKLMSSFIWEAEREREQNRVVSTNTVTTVKETTSVDSSNDNSVVKTTIQNTTVVDALQVKGPSLSVTPGMTCYMIRVSRDTSVLKKNVECGLLQAYAQSSFRNNARRNAPRILISVIFSLIFLVK
ncbi:uncharacterized protein LOC126373866 [Pectinophora gossypiella]|uniref:uncharacterized protein LOC126373866 n=1 Tax=Pectinophora gossypiella TaxID=13191 RepID=UPI00214F305C|nr:uncharacterized protein LOC126373866 [Pectinophora gossypiella]